MPTGAIITGGALLGLAASEQDRRAAQRNVETAERQRDESREFIERNIREGRQDLFKLFGEAQRARRGGIEAGLDIFRQTIPARLEAFQQGALGAQDILTQGLPGIEAAILGQPGGLSFQLPQIRGIEGLQIPQLPPQINLQPASPSGLPEIPGIPGIPTNERPLPRTARG